MIALIDTHVFLKPLLENDHSFAEAVASATERFASEIARYEAMRIIGKHRGRSLISEQDRERAVEAFNQAFGACSVVPLSDLVLERIARPFPKEGVGANDAIHLATAEYLKSIYGTQVTVFSSDKRVRENAAAMGLDLFPAA